MTIARYVRVGGLAVVLHGIDRLTADSDLVVDLAPDEASRVVEVLLEMGYKPQAPVDPRKFADQTIRTGWQRDAGMVVLSFGDPENRRPTVDLFADYPLDFDALYRRSNEISLNNPTVRIASVEHLIAIKRAAGRAIDDDANESPPAGCGTWQDAEALRKWSLLRRTPQQRLDWLVEALTIKYQVAALRHPARGLAARDEAIKSTN